MPTIEFVTAVLAAPIRATRNAFTDFTAGICWIVFTILLTALSFAIPSSLNLAIFVLVWAIIASLHLDWKDQAIPLVDLEKSLSNGLLFSVILSIPWGAIAINLLTNSFQSLLS